MGVSRLFDDYFTRLSSGAAAPWNFKTLSALFALIALWAAWMYSTWPHWGNLSVDCGREMYVASELTEGKTLYRDVWYLFGPASPYFNSFLFRIFGVHLNVLYWAGSLSALGSAILLYLVGMRLSSWLAGWTAAAVVVIQAFHPSLFSFPLPYSFASVYGCLVSCLFLWFAVRALTSSGWAWVFGAGMASAVAMLLKPEFGIACYVSLMLLIAARGLRLASWKSVLQDAARILPGALLCVFVLRWMISLAGIEFLTQENFQSWPTSFFMRTYGKLWLASTGFSFTGAALAEAAQRTFAFLGIAQGLHLLASWKRTGKRETILRAALFLAALASLVVTLPWHDALRVVFFPQDMGAYVLFAAIAAWWYFWRQPGSAREAAMALLLTFAVLLAFRIMLRVIPWAYPIYYNGPVLLSFLLLARPFVSRSGHSRLSASRGELLICFLCLAVTLMNSRRADTLRKPLGLLTTSRGSILVTKNLADQYQEAIQFMKEKNAQGEAVLSVPEDTSLYFLSGTHCPTRVFAFTPGLVAPGKMTDELISEIGRKPVRYLIWSNRIFPEYGVPRFGVDFD